MSRLSSSRLLSQTSKPSLRLEPRSSRHFQTYYTSSRAQPQFHLQAQQQQSLPRQSLIQKRTFLSNFIPSPPKPSSNSSSNNDPNNNGNGRILTATRTLPYTSEPLFAVISSVESYSQFLPFLTASTVTARDEKTGLPSQAFLTVGYGPLSETFTSKVECKPEEGIVEARSGEKYIDPNSSHKSGTGGFGALASLAGFPGADEGIFEYLSTRWELVPEAAGEGGEPRTTVKLEISFEFKSQLYASMMSAVEGQMAGIMIEAFEKRVREINGR
ncbi:dehydrase and lipid transport-domain-containing protein [Aspergillus venezuelensis]